MFSFFSPGIFADTMAEVMNGPPSLSKWVRIGNSLRPDNCSLASRTSSYFGFCGDLIASIMNGLVFSIGIPSANDNFLFVPHIPETILFSFGVLNKIAFLPSYFLISDDA